MKKQLTCLILFLTALFWFPTAAAASTTHIEDDADLFSDTQIQQLETDAAALGKEIKGEVYIHTTFDYIDDMQYYSNVYLKGKVGETGNGAVLVIDMNQRNYYISTMGNMIDFITDSRLETMKQGVEDSLRNGDNFGAATSYLTDAKKYVKAGVPGGHYRIDSETGKITYYKVLTATEILIALAAAAVAAIAFFVVIKSKYQLKMGTYKYPYQQNSEVNLTVNENRLINSFVTTRRIPRNNSSGGGFGGGGGSTTNSSGGGTFGGGGGSF